MILEYRKTTSSIAIKMLSYRCSSLLLAESDEASMDIDYTLRSFTSRGHFRPLTFPVT
jgi:hypothetical protein